MVHFARVVCVLFCVSCLCVCGSQQQVAQTLAVVVMMCIFFFTIWTNLLVIIFPIFLPVYLIYLAWFLMLVRPQQFTTQPETQHATSDSHSLDACVAGPQRSSSWRAKPGNESKTEHQTKQSSYDADFTLWQWGRKWSLWRLFRDYFPADLVAETPLDPK